MTETMPAKSPMRYWLPGIISAVAIFALLYLAVNVVLKNAVMPSNLIPNVVVAVLSGGFIVLFLRFRLYAATALFYLGLTLGFIQMFRLFFAAADGWGDLVGIISFLFFSGAGLLSGLLVQLIWFIVKRERKRSRIKDDLPDHSGKNSSSDA